MFIPVFENKSECKFEFGKNVCAAANHCLNNESFKSFWKGFCCQASELKLESTDELIFSIGEAQKPTLDGNQYAVNIESTGLCIIGESKRGLINGFMTLLDLIEVKQISDEKSVFAIQCGAFKEKPMIKNQMIHFCIFPETELWELEKFIRFCAALKFSHIVLEFWGMLRFDCMKELSWRNAYSKEQIRPIIRMANELGVEIIPMFNHLGHAAASRAMHGKHVVLDQNPSLQPLFTDDGWTWNIENPDTLRLLRCVREELIDLCGEGEYFHLGCDEVYNFKLTPENHTIMTDYLNGLSEELSACGRRPIIWGDMLIAKHESFNRNNHYITSCEDEELEQSLLTDLDRNIIIADWQYCVKEAPVQTSLIFKDAGFDTLICPWDATFGDHSIQPCIDTAVGSELFGVLYTTWHTLTKGMIEVTKAAFGAWYRGSRESVPPHGFFATNAAKIMRRVYPVYGDYERAGWSKVQIGALVR